MYSALLNMGSNIDPEQHLLQAAAALRALCPTACFSAVYRSAAVGMDGDDFLNACCLLQTELPLEALRQQLKILEDAQHRDRSQGSWRPRTLDLDILIYDGTVIDDDIYRYAHAFVPAAELVSLALPSDTEQRTTRVNLQLTQ
jgi:2-amino-4-hydroxy-6-hydroxymethyldihydropteridine diphosphokinase